MQMLDEKVVSNKGGRRVQDWMILAVKPRS